jgi:hypothetical protein
MLPLFIDVALLAACFVAGAWTSEIYHAHRAYRVRLINLRVRMAEWAVAA